MLESIDYIGLAVRDINESISFYSAMFGMTDWERIACPSGLWLWRLRARAVC